MAAVLQVVEPTDDPWLKEMRQKVARADADRNLHKSRIADCYRYALPWRHRFDQTQPTDQIDEIFDPTAMEVLEDFAADMLNTFTPQKNNWLTEEPVEYLDEGQKRIIADALAERQRIVFAEMARSNLYQALQEAYLDLGVGTMHLLITEIGATKPLHCEAIPSTDKLITRGPFGLVDGHFRRKSYCWSDIKVLWPEANLALIGQPPTNPEQDYEVTDGCWRDWNDLGDETYRYAVECKGKIIYRKEYKGEGSCPFNSARWSRDSTTAWGVGPTYQQIPNIKTLQQIRYLDLKNYDKHVDPPTSFEDDGIINVDNGVPPGMWVPRAVGSKAPEPIESKARLDLSVFERDELRSAVKRAHYQDRPEQLGKTPPTATQWADERAERARRMGSPATNLVVELQYWLYRRFTYLLEQRGVLKKVLLDGRAVSLQPISPLLRAQEQEEVIRLDRFAELIAARFGPQIALIVIDVVKYSGRQAKLLGIDKNLLRDEDGIVQAMKQLLPILENFAGGAGGDVAPPELGTLGG